jgi:hypothetical protein
MTSLYPELNAPKCSVNLYDADNLWQIPSATWGQICAHRTNGPAVFETYYFYFRKGPWQ